jgi:GMP synthase (glutamine-hydrolysing)
MRYGRDRGRRLAPPSVIPAAQLSFWNELLNWGAMRVLSLIHQEDAPTGVFAEVVRERGHELVEWNVAGGAPPAEDGFDAFFVFGGAMHVDQEHAHPWLSGESEFIRRLLAATRPVFGVCLGSQLIAKAAGARVGPANRPEIGWHQVELTPEGERDPILGSLPARFDALQWHSYAFDLPRGGVPLARNSVCLQAFRIGEHAWGVQFHPEITPDILERWLAHDPGGPEQPHIEGEPLPRWNELGRRLAASFLDAVSPTR